MQLRLGYLAAYKDLKDHFCAEPTDSERNRRTCSEFEGAGRPIASTGFMVVGLGLNCYYVYSVDPLRSGLVCSVSF